MSLVITSNRDSDRASRQEDSIYSAFSYRNGLSSTYKIPANSQVCLQSAKVNLDGRATLTRNNSWFYTWHGKDLKPLGEGFNDGTQVDFNNQTCYPILQSINQGGNEILELTTDELADKISTSHREYHPNLMTHFKCTAQRNAGLDFLGYNMVFNQSFSQAYATLPSTFEKFYADNYPLRTSYNSATGVLTSLGGEVGGPVVSIGLGTPLSLSNGSCVVDIQNCNASDVAWGVGLSRDCPNPDTTEIGSYEPPYFDPYDSEDETEEMGLTKEDYFEDWGVHRNEDSELVIRHAVPNTTGDGQINREIKYYNNASSDLADPGKRYAWTAAGGASKILKIRFTILGEKVRIEGMTAAGSVLITEYTSGQPKNSYPKPVSQTCWCLHPVLYIGGINANTLTIDHFSGIPLATYNSRRVNTPSSGGRHYNGWWENSCLLGTDGAPGNLWRAIARCKEVDMREINDPENATKLYIPISVNASFAINCSTAMILKTSNEIYPNTWGASMSELLGFPGRSIVNKPTDANFPLLTFASDSAPQLDSMLSVFVRLNNFGQQVMNARTGNKSTILAHLPTADSKVASGSSQRIFFEPKNLVWLDINNPYDMIVSEFNIDFVYSNEQYAKILQGQSIVCLYFRVKPE